MATLLAEWEDLLRRRSAFRDTLEPLGPILAAWAAWPPGRITPLPWIAERWCRCWQAGVPLLAEAPPAIERESLDEVLGPALDLLARLEEDHTALREFAQAWDEGEIEASALLPERGRIGAVEIQERCHLSQDALAFLSVAGLRPLLETYFAECRAHIEGSAWDLGVCPCCGAPPGFTDLLEDGRRRLACHLCGSAWIVGRLTCPFCGNRIAGDFVRLLAEDKDEGFAISACRACHGYVKELDRRVRWNAGSALVEDWGSPHLDLIAYRQDYWRPIPTLIQLAPPRRPG